MKYGLETNMLSWPQKPHHIQSKYVQLSRAFLSLLIRWGSVTFKALRAQMDYAEQDHGDLDLQNLNHIEELLGCLDQIAFLLNIMCTVSSVLFKNIKYEAQFLWDITGMHKRMTALRDLARDYGRSYEDLLSEQEFAHLSKLLMSMKSICLLTGPLEDLIDSYIRNRWKGKLLKDQLSSKQVSLRRFLEINHYRK